MALYNNGYPASYQSQFYQPQQSYVPQQQNYVPQQNSSIIWVQGEAGAKSYLVAPNTTVQLWDSESQTIYLKSADASGMPSIKILDYKIRGNTPQMHENAPESVFATVDDINTLKAEIKQIKEDLDHVRQSESNLTV